MGRMFFPRRVSSEGCHLESVWRVELSAQCTMGFDADITEQSGSGAQWVKWCRAAGLLLYQLRREISSGDDTGLSAASVACHGD